MENKTPKHLTVTGSTYGEWKPPVVKLLNTGKTGGNKFNPFQPEGTPSPGWYEGPS